MDERVQKGLALRQAREAKGISLEAVQEATKIPLDSLKAIEEGYKVRTLTDFYYKAFVKMYSKYLGVDVAEILVERQNPTLVKAIKPPKPVKPVKLAKLTNSVKPMNPPKPVNVVNPVSLEKSSKPSEPLNYKEKQKIPFVDPRLMLRIFFVFLFILALVVCFRMGSAWLASRPKSLPKKVQVKMKKSEPKTVEKAKFFSGKKTLNQKPLLNVSPAPSSAPVTINRNNKKINLVVKTKKDTWINICVDGVTVSRASLKKGIVESWTASESIELSGKNLNDLEFELNGQSTNPFGKTRRGVKKIRITKDGFKIED